MTTWHWGPQYHLVNPRPLSGQEPLILRAELYRSDDDAGIGETRMYVNGETDLDLGADETEIFIGQMQAFVDTLRVLRRQMG